MLQIFEVSCRVNDGWLGTLRVGDLRFCTLAGEPVTREVFLAALEGKRVCIAAHGYHNKEADADNFANTIAQGIEREELPYDVLILFSWSGGLTYAGFGLAAARTKSCGEKLRQLLWLISGSYARTSIDVVSHSLGAGVVAEALSNSALLLAERWIALSAAIPNDSLSEGGKYDAHHMGVVKILVPFSEKDQVLNFAYRVGSFFHSALGRTGPKGTIDVGYVKPIDVAEWVESHHAGFAAPQVYDFWHAFTSGLI